MEPSEAEVREKVDSDIKHYGWSILSSVYKETLYTHTLGLRQSFDHPDLEILGLSKELAESLLNELAYRVKEGASYSNMFSITDLVDDCPLILVGNPLEPKEEAILGDRLRLIWPDEHGYYPWQNQCDPGCSIQLFFPDTTLSKRHVYEARALMQQASARS